MRNSESHNNATSGDISVPHETSILASSSSDPKDTDEDHHDFLPGAVVVADDVDGYDDDDADDEDGDDEYVNISVRRDDDLVAEAAQVWDRPLVGILLNNASVSL